MTQGGREESIADVFDQPASTQQALLSMSRYHRLRASSTSRERLSGICACGIG